jgi:tetratricopeptide (TPR) repeat protein
LASGGKSGNTADIGWMAGHGDMISPLRSWEARMPYWIGLTLGSLVGLCAAASLAQAESNEDCSQRIDNDLAIRACSDLIRRNPRDGWAYANRGDAYRRKGENDRAIDDLNEAIRLDPRDLSAYVYRGQVYEAKGKRCNAIEDYNKALALPANGEFQQYRQAEARLRLTELLVPERPLRRR